MLLTPIAANSVSPMAHASELDSRKYLVPVSRTVIAFKTCMILIFDQRTVLCQRTIGIVEHKVEGFKLCRDEKTLSVFLYRTGLLATAPFDSMSERHYQIYH